MVAIARLPQLACLALLLAFLTAPMRAQSEEVDAAKSAAESWLALVDGGKYDESWHEAAASFQAQVSKDKWVETLESVRGQLGANKSRTVKGAKYTKELPNAPAGEYVVIQYEASFENASAVVETVTPMKQEDGAWRVTGYFVRPAQ